VVSVPANETAQVGGNNFSQLKYKLWVIDPSEEHEEKREGYNNITGKSNEGGEMKNIFFLFLVHNKIFCK
jgi:hypothetical protein